jgi:hypothetical protein
VFGVIFTWPKMLAIFFALTSVNTIIYDSHRKDLIAVSGLGLSLSYLSHPMTIVMGPILAIVVIVLNTRYASKASDKNTSSKAKSLLLNTIIFLLPIIIASFSWKIWYTWHGVSPPDLFSQNFSQDSLSNFESLTARLSSLGDLFSVTPALNATILSIFRTLGFLSNEVNSQEQLIFAKFLTTFFSMPFLLIAPLIVFSNGDVFEESSMQKRARFTLFAIFFCLALALVCTFSRGGIILWHGYLCALLPFASYFLACLWLNAKSGIKLFCLEGIFYGFIALNFCIFWYWAAIT